jgi:GntR family transcriptional repressor for pyruvate dehydrogenase complex
LSKKDRLQTTHEYSSADNALYSGDTIMHYEQFQVERKRLADQVADTLMDMIGNGTFSPGDRLPSEPELMRQFNVGRSSIREAVGALSLVGLLTVRPGQGTHVADFSPDNRLKSMGLLGIGREKVCELVEARIELETVIVRLAAERATAEDLAAITKSHAALKASLIDKTEPIEADLDFHMAVARANHNSVLIKFFSEMRQTIRYWMEEKARYDWGYEQVHEQHETIVMAIKTGNARRAEDALKAHLQSTGEKLVASMLQKN